jgi:hypothetical protein
MRALCHESAYKNDIKHLTSLSIFAFTFTIGFSLGILHPRSQFNSVFQMIKDWEVEKPFGGKGVCTNSGIRASIELNSIGREVN